MTLDINYVNHYKYYVFIQFCNIVIYLKKNTLSRKRAPLSLDEIGKKTIF
jgi:hypothetical protein